MRLAEGDKVPAFKLPDQEGTVHELKEYEGKWVVIYFYPKDNTPGCTKEACNFRDNIKPIEKLGAEVIGVSTDSVKKHSNFVAKYDLPFTLLADEEQKMVNDYGVWGLKKFMGREYMGTNRMTFIVDPKGKIAKVYPKVKAATHGEEVLEDLKTLTA
ncbi:MAG: thioredoxin-dependent thiol peroxidase [Gemmatimonadetes bacterium]|nr:thioredoxin-dependent thiol peroxidase [Gemmatimonadota bacterium]|tara:strand:- start:3603 stop:4073 length:471 start_codon:yes stop_codon:yes gene_type:complete